MRLSPSPSAAATSPHRTFSPPSTQCGSRSRKHATRTGPARNSSETAALGSQPRPDLLRAIRPCFATSALGPEAPRFGQMPPVSRLPCAEGIPDSPEQIAAHGQPPVAHCCWASGHKLVGRLRFVQSHTCRVRHSCSRIHFPPATAYIFPPLFAQPSTFLSYSGIHFPEAGRPGNGFRLRLSQQTATAPNHYTNHTQTALPLAASPCVFAFWNRTVG